MLAAATAAATAARKALTAKKKDDTTAAALADKATKAPAFSTASSTAAPVSPLPLPLAPSGPSTSAGGRGVCAQVQPQHRGEEDRTGGCACSCPAGGYIRGNSD
jgi:hypothetical protein